MRYLHVIDEKCNLLKSCKEGCFNCYQWYSDNCAKCENNYYKEDFLPQQNYFRCFNETTCQGVTPYKNNSSLRIGGVPVIEDEIKVCLNCRLRNNSYRQPENKNNYFIYLFFLKKISIVVTLKIKHIMIYLNIINYQIVISDVNHVMVGEILLL